MNFDKLLGNVASAIDVADRIEGIVSGSRYSDWSGAIERHGPLGVFVEFVSYLSGYNSPKLKVSHFNVGSSWSGIRIEWLLRRHGIVLWDRGLEGDDLYFRVKRRQLNWAEYVMLRAGVPVAVRNRLNEAWAARHPAGDEPARHSKRRRG
jgi:hypothetical protein